MVLWNFSLSVVCHTNAAILNLQIPSHCHCGLLKVVQKGQRISQGLFLKHMDATFEVNNDEHIWNDTTHHGFGITG